MDVDDTIRIKVWHAEHLTMVLPDTQEGAPDFGFPTLTPHKGTAKPVTIRAR